MSVFIELASMPQTAGSGPGSQVRPARGRYTAQVSATALRISRGSAVRMLALLLNAAAFLIGVYFVVRPRDRRDVLSAAGVAAAAVLSAAALTVAATGEARCLVLRLRRIALS